MIVIGAGLLFSGISKMHEAAGRANCNNNVRDIGVSIQNYLDVNACFPPGTVRNQLLPAEKRLSWLVEILPYIESTNLVFDKKKSWDAEENLRLRDPKGTRRNVGEYRLFLCPSNPIRADLDWPGLSHYVGIAGLGRDAAELSLREGEDSAIRRDVGFFGYDRKIKPEDIPDGLATTLAVAETRAENGPWTAGGRATVRGLDSQLPYLGSGGQIGGNHIGRAMVLMADGSARFIGESIQPKVFEALATIAGGEEVGQIDDG